MKNPTEGKLKKKLLITKYKFIWIIFFLNIFNNLQSYEIIRDPVFEEYFVQVSNDLNLDEINVYLIRNRTPNAFVIEDNIYFTTGLLAKINDEATIKSIYLHEYGHVIKNHFKSKKIKTHQSRNKSEIFSLLSIGLAVLTGNANIGIGSSVTLSTKLVNEISKHSVSFEIEADNFMIDQIKKNKINTSELISFLNEVQVTDNIYFKTHPKKEDRIYSLQQINYPRIQNSISFEWIKAKYSNNSDNKLFNIFFTNLKKGIFDQNQKFNNINKELIKYEAFKKGIYVNDWENEFFNLLNINSNSFLKIEYINYILENNLDKKYHIINELKFDKKLMNEYFYYFIYGKYYNKINDMNLSNFYFCQFYRLINSNSKADFFCKNYNIKNIPTLDKSYALFK